MSVENPGMSSILDLMPSTKVVRTSDLKDRELAQRAASTALAFGANNKAESKVLNLLRQGGPQASVQSIVAATGLSASVASETVSNLIDRGAVRREVGLLGDKPRIAAA